MIVNVAQWIENGNRLLESGQLDQAGEAYAQAIRQEPNKAFHHFKLGNVLLKQQQIDAAERCFQQALSLNKESHLGLYGMAQVAAARNQWQEALDRYKHLLTFNPGFAAGVYDKVAIASSQLKKEKKNQLKKELERLSQWPYMEEDSDTGLSQPPDTLPDGETWPKISVITPSFNQGSFIEETILSVINQNYPNVEYIVIDGGSTDQTQTILDQYKDHFTYCVSEPDDGQSAAINKGFERATGEIFTWLNSDDRFSPGALYAAALAFYTSGADMVAGACELLIEGKLSGKHLASCASGSLQLNEILDAPGCWLTGRFFYQPEVMFTRELWQRAGGYVDTQLYYSMDYELWARFAHAKAKIEVIGAPIAQYRMHEAQKTNTTEAYKPELLKTCQQLQERFDCPVTGQAGISAGIPADAMQRPLRVVFFNDVGDRGGAGIAHHRIAQAFESGGHQVTSIAATLDWSLTPSGCLPQAVIKAISASDPDLVVVGNIHNVQHSLAILRAISDQFVTLFIMHDQWMLTGRCAYTGGCTQYVQTCDQTCPTWDTYPVVEPQQIAGLFETKRALIESPNFFVAADSTWLADWAQEARVKWNSASLNEKAAVSKLHPKPSVQAIHYGLDTSIFKPGDKVRLRQRLGLPEDKFIIITGSQSLADERKGSQLLLEALRLIHRDEVHLVCFGHGTAAIEDDLDISFTGFVESPEVLSWYYGAADLFVGPSREEAFGQTFIEAAACGTPAVGFRVGGVTQAIAHNISGMLVEVVEALALAQGILALIDNPAELKRLSKSAPIYIRNQFSLQRSYYSFVRCLENSGILAQLNIRATAKFNRMKAVPKPTAIEAGASAALNQPLIAGKYIHGLLMGGFGHAELPRPDLNLAGGSRWLLWPTGRFSINASETQSGHLTLYFRNMQKGQKITLQQGNETIFEVLASTHSIKEMSAISLPMVLKSGLNFFDIRVSDFHSAAKNGQKLGILMEKVLFSKLPATLPDNQF